MNLPYYITWDKQNTDKAFPIQSYESCYFLTDKGEKIIDLSSISYHCPFGGRPKPILDSMRDQMNRFCCASPKAMFDLKYNSSMRLLNFLGFGSGKIFYTVSGAESVENALKIARVYTGKNIILARSNSYHGASLGALSITGDWRNQNAPTMDEWTARIPEPHEDPNLEKTEKIIQELGSEKIAAFCLETITGGNGVIIPEQSWYDGIQNLCKKYDILLILDEVVGGFYRTGEPFAFKHYNLKPDIVCMAKIITGGMIPFGALWTNKKISDHFEDIVLPCGLTNYAHPLGLAAMNGVLDIMHDNEFINSLHKLSEVFKKKMETFQNLNDVVEVRVKGLLGAIEFKAPVDSKKLFKANFYVQTNKNNLVIAPPYIMSEQLLADSLEQIKGLLS